MVGEGTVAWNKLATAPNSITVFTFFHYIHENCLNPTSPRHVRSTLVDDRLAVCEERSVSSAEIEGRESGRVRRYLCLHYTRIEITGRRSRLGVDERFRRAERDQC
jgi:hypothetical protein